MYTMVYLSTTIAICAPPMVTIGSFVKREGGKRKGGGRGSVVYVRA